MASSDCKSLLGLLLQCAQHGNMMDHLKVNSHPKFSQIKAAEQHVLESQST